MQDRLERNDARGLETQKYADWPPRPPCARGASSRPPDVERLLATETWSGLPRRAICIRTTEDGSCQVPADLVYEAHSRVAPEVLHENPAFACLAENDPVAFPESKDLRPLPFGFGARDTQSDEPYRAPSGAVTSSRNTMLDRVASLSSVPVANRPTETPPSSLPSPSVDPRFPDRGLQINS